MSNKQTEEKLELLKQMVLTDIRIFEKGLENNPNDEYHKGGFQEAKDVLYEINKLLEET